MAGGEKLRNNLGAAEYKHVVLGDEENRSRDILGRVCEFFLSSFASAEGKGATPPRLVLKALGRRIVSGLPPLPRSQRCVGATVAPTQMAEGPNILLAPDLVVLTVDRVRHAQAQSQDYLVRVPRHVIPNTCDEGAVGAQRLATGAAGCSMRLLDDPRDWFDERASVGIDVSRVP